MKKALAALSLIVNIMMTVSVNIGAAGTMTSAELNTIRQAELSKHNSYRAMHGASPVTLNSQLSIQAQSWAEHLYLTDSFFHSNHQSQYGENLYKKMAYPSLNYQSQASDSWYSENVNYDYTTGTSTGGVIGHFTAMIWDDVTEIGVGVVGGEVPYDYQGTTFMLKVVYVVVRYTPTPNILGTYTSHVHPTSS